MKLQITERVREATCEDVRNSLQMDDVDAATVVDLLVDPPVEPRFEPRVDAILAPSIIGELDHQEELLNAVLMRIAMRAGPEATWTPKGNVYVLTKVEFLSVR